MLVKEINNNLAWLANKREFGLRWVESKFRENVAQYQGDINPQNPHLQFLQPRHNQPAFLRYNVALNFNF